MKIFFYVLALVLFLQTSINCNANNDNSQDVSIENFEFDFNQNLVKRFKKSKTGKKYKYTLPKIDLKKYPVTIPSKRKINTTDSLNA